MVVPWRYSIGETLRLDNNEISSNNGRRNNTDVELVVTYIFQMFLKLKFYNEISFFWLEQLQMVGGRRNNNGSELATGLICFEIYFHDTF